jgi:hypothetical protein
VQTWEALCFGLICSKASPPCRLPGSQTAAAPAAAPALLLLLLLLLQDQERELLQRGFATLQDLEQERVAALMQAGKALAESYSSAVAGMPAAAAMLQGMLGELGDAGEAGVQHLAEVAAGNCHLLGMLCC